MSDMGCRCSCSCDYEAASCFWSKIVRARKQHVCCECGETIERGDKYERVAMIFEGDFSSHKTCMPCYLIGRDLCCGCYVVGMLRETIREELGFDYLTTGSEDTMVEE